MDWKLIPGNRLSPRCSTTGVRMQTQRLAAVGMVLLVWGLCGFSAPAHTDPISFNRDIRPILSENCYACHGPDPGERKADLRLDTEAGLFTKQDETPILVPGNPHDSELFRRISSNDPDVRMAPIGREQGVKS